ncbi:Protein phosphatase 2C [Hymenobacter arizonensis]|uniref:Protein phosphatase 2C n=2 Tax=Hymenobacter arizonensis TaxID=1227077 RepID=A0A1I5Z7P1_HYMAR|nr:Protein phosphatase 2C [Hymenobacter arizonensis]
MLLETLSFISFMTNSGLSFLAGSAFTVAMFLMRNEKQKRLAQARQPIAEEAKQQVLVEPQKESTLVSDVPAAPLSSGLLPKVELLISAGPRKSTRETELGEDVAGSVLTPNRVIFWVLDGTSDTVVIPGEQGRDLLSSRLFCLAISAALHQLAHKFTDAHKLAEAALDEAAAQLKSLVAEHQESFQKFGKSEPEQTSHWDVSTTMLVGILSDTGEVDLFRIGDSKAICFGLDKQVVATVVDQKPASIGLGRIHARLVRGELFTLQLFTPDREDQLHRGRASGVRRIIAFSDGVGPSTEQYLRRMLAQRTYSQFHDELGRTPNKTFDDKTLVLASFEPVS